MRKRRAVKRDVLPDPIYNSKVVTKLINAVMNDGKRGTASKILYEAFDIIKEQTKADPMETFNKAMENISPSLEVKSRRVGGSNVQVPIEVSETRKQTLALRWLVNYARLRPGKGMANKLAKKLWMLQMVSVEQLKNVMILTKWQKQTKHLLTIDGRCNRWQETFL